MADYDVDQDDYDECVITDSKDKGEDPSDTEEEDEVQVEHCKH
jgi:hypothetical protein